MPICVSCGFDKAEEGKPCRVCGSSQQSATMRADDMATEIQTPGSNPGGAMPAPVSGTYDGRYEIKKFLGRGGMGSVYLALDHQTGDDVALKILNNAAYHGNTAWARFQREISLLTRVKHPAVPRVHSFGRAAGDFYFAADFIEGRALRDVLREAGALPIARAAAIGAEVADALEAAHACSVVHRDVKPHNIIIRPDGSAVLLDFGIARPVGLDLNQGVTATGMIVGTPNYMSPEQFRGSRVTGKSDIYSLGVVLFELATGTVPFEGETPALVSHKHQHVEPPSPRKARADVPAWYERIVLRCLEKDPARRFDDAAELAAELRRTHRGTRRTRALSSGDSVIEDDTESERWSLILMTKQERKSWNIGMALLFRDRYYRLDDTSRDPSSNGWIYRFIDWPQEAVLRKVIDYEADAAEVAKEAKSLKGRLQKLFK